MGHGQSGSAVWPMLGLEANSRLGSRTRMVEARIDGDLAVLTDIDDEDLVLQRLEAGDQPILALLFALGQRRANAHRDPAAACAAFHGLPSGTSNARTRRVRRRPFRADVIALHTVPAQELSRCSILNSRQSLKHLRCPGPVDYPIVLANFAVTENQYALCELRDVMLVRHQNNC